MKPVLCSLVLCALLALAVPASGDNGGKLRENKQELDRIKTELQETKDKVDSLKQEEAELQKTITGYNERVSRNRTLVKNLEKRLSGVRGEITANTDLLQSNQDKLVRKRDSYLSLLREWYRRRNARADFNLQDFGTLLDRSRTVRYLASVSGGSTREIARVGDSVRLLTQYVDSLEQEGSQISRVRRDKKAKIDLDLTLKKKDESNLGSVRRQSTLLRDRLVALSEVARQMEEIIARLEEEQESRRRTQGPAQRFAAGSFEQTRGRLHPPIKGTIVSAFGWKKNKLTNLTSFSPGIDIKPAGQYKEVMACAPGRVVYVGTLRGYENFVIVEHDDGYYTTYAGLRQVAVEADELVDGGSIVGMRGDGNVHFEIRRGREHLDPVIWLDIDGF